MTTHAGVLRRGDGLTAAAEQLDRWAAVVQPEALTDAVDPREHEDRNLLLAARLLVGAAVARTVSLGAHYRADTDPAPAPTHFMQRISL